MKKALYSVILISYLLLHLFFPNIASAALRLNLDYPAFGGFDLNNNQSLTQIAAWFYYFIVGVAGLATFVMLVWGGVEWLTSAGNPTRISDAKNRITSAFFGLLIILGSWLILQVINPDLTIFKLP